jgi:PAS domain S-box-containing protein
MLAEKVSGATNLFLTIYVYLKNPKEKINRNFLWFGGSLVLWCLANLFLLFYQHVVFLRITYAVGTVFALASIFFVSALAGIKIKEWISVILISLTIIWSAINAFTPLILVSLNRSLGFGWETVSGPLSLVWEIYILLMILASVIIPIISLRTSNETRRKQLFYYITGETLFAAWVIVVFLILPAFGINQFNNLDSPATLFLVGFTSYSIVKYNLLGIRSLFFQALMYTLVIIGLIAGLLLLMFIGSSLLNQSQVWPLYVIAIVIAAVLFIIGRIFFKEKKELENSKLNLIKLLDVSEKNRVIAETERDKTLTIINSFVDSLIILDEKGKIISINPEAEKTLKLKSEKLLKKPISALVDFPKAKQIASRLAGGLSGISKEEITLEKDVIQELSVIPLNFGKNKIGHLIILHDISREKMVETMKTEFVSLVAHQLRTPLTIVKWSMGMLKKGSFGEINEKQDEIIGRIIFNNDRMISLVNNLLNITRIEEGRYLYQTTPINLTDIVNYVLKSYKDEITKRKISVEFKEPKDFPKTLLDDEKIKLVVQNLIDNALKYSPQEGKIIISLSNDKKNIEFKIEDFGIGIPDTQQKKIFTKFFRGDNANKVDTTGSGLGLFLTQNIVNAHNGKIWFESEEGTGTTFHFSLPIITK